MRLIASVAGLLLATVVFVTDGSSAKAQTQNNQPQEPKKVQIQPGDTLTKIAADHQMTYPRLFDANENIEHPDVIYPGETLRVPSPEEQLPSRPLPADMPPVAAPAPAAVTAPAAQQQTAVRPSAAQAAPGAYGGVWDQLAQCESGGNWSINTGNGFYGGLQFTLSSWQAVGGSGYPHQASKAEQISRGQMLQAMQGWGAWPACTAKLGIR